MTTLIDKRGNPLPKVVQVATMTGTQWWAVSDGMGAYYIPERDCWRAAPYTFACREHAEEALRNLLALRP